MANKVLTKKQQKAVRKDFREWSGGFKPEDKHQINCYVDHARPARLDATAVFMYLEEWWLEEPEDGVCLGCEGAGCDECENTGYTLGGG